jgi:predicted Rossmann fold flavoprotein
MEYNRIMERVTLAIIGGGAAGLMLANSLKNPKGALVIERGERLGKKLSSTGNGQGNLTNLGVLDAEYFSVGKKSPLVENIIKAHDDKSITEFFRSLGVLCIADERGRVYPSGRQASALTDALRFALARKGVETRLQTQVTKLEGKGEGFILTLQTPSGEEKLYADKVVLCAGGKAAKNFGTDGSAYALAQGFGHTVTKLYPSLVQLKTNTEHTKTLKGIRINDGVIEVKTPTRALSVQGDIIFTDYGVSGDAVFRLSAFIADEIEKGQCELYLDFLPQYTEEEVYALLREKKSAFPDMAVGELLFGVVNNQVGRAVLRRAANDLKAAASLVKAFPLTVTGSLGFDYAQVTKGGILLTEVDEGLGSRLKKGLYFAGEILDVDGQCGGFNLQWAYASARMVAQSLEEK